MEGGKLVRALLRKTDEGLFFEGPHLPIALHEWLLAYAAKGPSPSGFLPLFLGILPPFTQKVLRAIGEIPFGETINYGTLAEKVNNPKAVRATGSACGRNPFPLFIPCHRVTAKGSLGGFAFDIDIKKELLSFER